MPSSHCTSLPSAMSSSCVRNVFSWSASDTGSTHIGQERLNALPLEDCLASSVKELLDAVLGRVLADLADTFPCMVLAFGPTKRPPHTHFSLARNKVCGIHPVKGILYSRYSSSYNSVCHMLRGAPAARLVVRAAVGRSVARHVERGHPRQVQPHGVKALPKGKSAKSPSPQ